MLLSTQTLSCQLNRSRGQVHDTGLPDQVPDPSAPMLQILKVLAWFVACGGDCRYKWEKKSGNFLELKENLRNFASSSEKTTSEWQEKKTISLTIKNSKIMVKKNEEESPRALNKEELEHVNGGGDNKKRKRWEE